MFRQNVEMSQITAPLSKLKATTKKIIGLQADDVGENDWKSWMNTS